jgi:hypothetical protein
MANGNGNGKNPRENCSFSIDIGLIPLLREYCTKHDRNQSDAVNLAIKLLLAIEKAKDPAFWKEQYGNTKE